MLKNDVAVTELYTPSEHVPPSPGGFKLHKQPELNHVLSLASKNGHQSVKSEEHPTSQCKLMIAANDDRWPSATYSDRWDCRECELILHRAQSLQTTGCI